jgi:hypothetical protein
MSNRKLIESKLLDKILNFFGGSSSNVRKEKFLDTIRKSEPQLAKAFDSWEDDFVNLLNATKKVKEKHGQNTADIDNLIRKYKG